MRHHSLAHGRRLLSTVPEDQLSKAREVVRVVNERAKDGVPAAGGGEPDAKAADTPPQRLILPSS